MRKRFEAQPAFGATPISEIEFNLKSRHELPPVLMALQYIFVNMELNESVFLLLEQRIYSPNNHTGRPGMSLWEIFVLSVVRLTLDVDYDFLHDLANNHVKIRQVLGINTSDFVPQKKYEYQTIAENLLVLDDELLSQINVLIVKQGHQIKKKEKGEESEKLILETKADSYVVETNVHFPTDINLLWDCARKCLDMVAKLKGIEEIKGWRELGSYRKKVRNAYRSTSEIHRKKGNNYKQRLKISTRVYLKTCRKLSAKMAYTIDHTTSLDVTKTLYLLQLEEYLKLMEKHIELVERRIIKEEVIPHSEKMFSIFETHTEWLNKGKSHKQVELGLNVVIATDQYNFIVDYKVVEKLVDKQITIEIGNRIVDKYSNEEYIHKSISFDRGFYSALSREKLSKKYEMVVLPKPGKKSKTEQEIEQQDGYKEKRKRHSLIESNINSLEHHGINRCPDKRIRGFKKYVALGVISYNLHQLGKTLMKEEKKNMPKIKQAA